MRFPDELWQRPEDLRAVKDLVVMFEDRALIVTDELANSVYLSAKAEALFQDRAEALVNRLVFSLLGFGSRDRVPPVVAAAMNGEGPAWRGVVNVAESGAPRWHFTEISAVKGAEGTLCGIVRISESEGIQR